MSFLRAQGPLFNKPSSTIPQSDSHNQPGVGAVELDEFHNNNFIQIDQNYLINCSFIQEIAGSTVYLTTGQSFPVPRRNIKSVKDKYIS